MKFRWLWLSVALSGCADPLGAYPWDVDMEAWRDQDGDGFAALARGGSDCDDLDPGVYPGAVAVRQGITMATVCGGTASMGSPEDEVGSGDDELLHEVDLSRAFEIGVAEVTQSQFERLMAYRPSGRLNCDDCPVENVSWHMAAQFTNTVSYEADLAPCYDCEGFGGDVVCEPVEWIYGCEGYRLPTEAEWERAARAGTHQAFSNRGELFPLDTSNCGGPVVLDNADLLSHLAIYCGNDQGMAEPVAGGRANPWGLYDVHGNVWEWCHDWYGPYEELALDPQGPDSGTQKVKRGGAWSSYPQSLRSAGRSSAEPGVAIDSIGFRLARTLP
jgi:formylglycine-generating enzyme required for sulfatase activity